MGKGDKQQQLEAEVQALESAPVATADGSESKSPAEKGKSAPAKKPVPAKHLISFSEYRAAAGRDEITPVLENGFRVWMKMVKDEPLRSRIIRDWDNLINQYLKS